MSIDERVPNIHNWMDYNPNIPQYYRFEPNIIAAAHKIIDVYQVFCSARSSLTYTEIDNYGELIDKTDDLHLNFIRSLFIQNSLVYYNIAIDLSWQVMWLFCEIPTFDLMYENRYINTTKECTLEELENRLSYMSSFPSIERKTLLSIHAHMVEFFNSELCLRIRQKYNYLKHRGTYHFEGLGMNHKNIGIAVDGFNPLMLTREEFNIDEWKEILIEFDNAFAKYFEYIIVNIMPSDFTNNNFSLSDPIYYDRKIREYLNNKSIQTK